MSIYHRVERKSNGTIAIEWDSLAQLRHDQIMSGSDITFHKVLTPEIFTYIGSRAFSNILDAGCGTGALTVALAKNGGRVDGVDISGESIRIAQKGDVPKNVYFAKRSIEFHSENTKRRYDLIVANMLLMDVMYLRRVLASIELLLSPKGIFIFSVTHPWFWPEYYGYSEEEWFSYKEEIFIEGPFKISADRTSSFLSGDELRSTHVHRPLSMYIDTIGAVGLHIETVSEPMPTAEVEALYPKYWKGPRYLVGVCTRK